MPAQAHPSVCVFAMLCLGGFAAGAATAAAIAAATEGFDATGQAAAPPPASTPLLPEKNLCENSAGAVALGSVQWNGWGRDLDNTRYQPEPALRAADVAKLALKWAYGSQNGAEFGQPTIVDGRVFVAGAAGRIYSLDAKTGCTYWTYDAAAASRTPIIIGELARARIAAMPRKIKRTLAHLDIIKAPSAAFFGDDTGAVYAVDAQKGTLLWKTQVDSHPLARIVGAPTLSNDRLYVAVSSTEEALAAANPNYSCCTFRGSVTALDIASGRTVWKSYTVLEEAAPTQRNKAGIQEFGPAGAAISSAPTIDLKRGVLYVATGRASGSVDSALTSAVVAFDLTDGKLRWVKQLGRADSAASSGFSSSPVLRTLASGNEILLAAQKSGDIYGLDPDHGGDILWQTRVAGAAAAPRAGATEAAGAVGPGEAGGVAWGTAADHRSLYVAISGLLAQPAAITGSLTALDLKTGIARWHATAPEPPCSWGAGNCSHAQAQAVTVIPGIAFSGSMDGHLRAYSTIDGNILWDFDTAKDWPTQNGIKAGGGPLDHGGATIVNGTVYVNSGNSLLAFTVNGK
jgi:polyvinyl alcohol dehydrogenase (cytochrome)